MSLAVCVCVCCTFKCPLQWAILSHEALEIQGSIIGCNYGDRMPFSLEKVDTQGVS